MADDLIPILTRFHREVVLPDIQRLVGEAVGGLEGRMTPTSTPSISVSTGCETEYQMLVAGLRRVEERLTGSKAVSYGVDSRLERVGRAARRG